MSSEQVSVHNKLPVETWTQIFDLATVPSGSDPFSFEGPAYFGMVCDDPSTVPPLISIKTREGNDQDTLYHHSSLQVLVFDWNPSTMGHLLVTLNPPVSILKGVANLLEEKPDLASAVKTLTVISGTRTHGLGAILSRLNQLKMVSMPLMPFIVSKVNVETALLTNSDAHLRNGLNMTSWMKVTTISIEFGHLIASVHLSDPQTIVFPQLRHLQVKGGNTAVLDNISENWSTPFLELLSVVSNDQGAGWRWKLFMAKCSQTLKKIEWKVHNPLIPESTPDHVEFPKLLELYMEHRSILQNDLRFITAPRLRRLGIFGLRFVPGFNANELLNSQITRILNAYKSVHELCIVNKGYYIVPRLVTSQWQKRGIKLDLRYPDRENKRVILESLSS